MHAPHSSQTSDRQSDSSQSDLALEGQRVLLAEDCPAQGRLYLEFLRQAGAEVTLKSGEKLALGGFRIIDEGKFNALSSEVFLEWRQRGWLHLVYSHLMSLSNWAGLVDRTAAGEG